MTHQNNATPTQIDWRQLPECGIFDTKCPWCGNEDGNFFKKAETTAGEKDVWICNKCCRLFKLGNMISW
ncbi:MAG: hypothetical protein ACOZBH_02700 [Patescibacteria group bacterium]